MSHTNHIQFLVSATLQHKKDSVRSENNYAINSFHSAPSHEARSRYMDWKELEEFQVLSYKNAIS